MKTAAIALAALAASAIPAPPTRPRLELDRAPLFRLSGLQPGDHAARCMFVRGANRLSLFGGGENGALAPHLRVRILRGCDGGEVLFDGRLDELPSEQRAIADRIALRDGERRAYRVEVAVLPSAPPAARAIQTFGVGAGSVASARAASCSRLSDRTVRRGALTVRIRRGRVTLHMRRRASAYRVNGVRTSSRPRIALFRPGRNTITVTVRRKRSRFTVTLRCEVRR